MEGVVTLKKVLAHSLLSAALVAVLIGGSVSAVQGLEPLSGVLALTIGVPLAVLLASRIGPLSIPAALFSALGAASVVWLWVLSGIRRVSLPVVPETTLWQVASFNGPVPLLQLWVVLSAAVVLSLLAFRRFGRSEMRLPEA